MSTTIIDFQYPQRVDPIRNHFWRKTQLSSTNFQYPQRVDPIRNILRPDIHPRTRPFSTLSGSIPSATSSTRAQTWEQKCFQYPQRVDPIRNIEPCVTIGRTKNFQYP